MATACRAQDPYQDENCPTPSSPATTTLNYDNRSDVPKSTQKSEITAFKVPQSETKGTNLNSQNIFYGEGGIDCQNSNNIKVAIRVRPFNKREEDDPDNRQCISIEKQGTELVLDRGVDVKKFNFDFVADSRIDQSSIFNHIAKPIADSCLQGYNGTIFAYGQTGAGKTYTIQGPSLYADDPHAGSLQIVEDQPQTSILKDGDDKRGIMQRSFAYIFQCIDAEKELIDEKGNGQALQFLVKCSFLEIYNEQIMDLLEPSQVNLQVREDINKGVYVEGLHEEIVSCQSDMLALIDRGAGNRHVGATSMNRTSSRSHSVLTTIIESKSRSATGVWNVKQSRFHIIDLAGSERQKVANTVGDRLKEAGAINKSLSALGNVINSLVDVSEGRNRFIPYRDSKLTFILRDSLGGNSKTVIIANISPSQMNIGETHSTLKFAQRAKLIRNKAVINEDSSGTLVLLKNEIKKLKRDLTETTRQVDILESERKMLTQSIADNAAQQLHPEFQKMAICRNCQQILSNREFDEEDELMDEGIINTDVLEYSIKTGSNEENRTSDPFANGKASEKDLNVLSASRKSGQRHSTLSGQIAQKLTSEQALHNFKREKRLSWNMKTTARQLCATNLGLEPQKTVAHLNERVLAAEHIISQNLFKHSSSEQEIRALRDANEKLQQSVNLFEQQNTHLNQIIEAKDKRIADLEAGQNEDQKQEQLKCEIVYLKEIIKKQIEKEQTPQVLKLEAKISELEQFKPSDPDNNQSQLLTKVEDQASMITELNEYFKSKCSLQAFSDMEQRLKSFEAEKDQIEAKHLQAFQKMQERLEEAQLQFESLQDQNMKIDEEAQTMTREYGRAKVEISGLKEQNQSLNLQLQSLETKNEQLSTEIQSLTVEWQQKGEQIESLTKDKDFTQIIINEMKEQSLLREAEIQEKAKLLEKVCREKDEVAQAQEAKQKELEIKSQMIESVQTEIESLKEQLKMTTDNAAKADKNFADERAKLEERLFQKQEEIKLLQNEIIKLTNELNSLQAENSQIEAQRQELLKALEEAKRENAQLGVKALADRESFDIQESNSKVIIETQIQQMKQDRVKHEDSQRQIQSLQDDLISKQEELASKDQQIQNLSLEHERLVKESKQLSDQLKQVMALAKDNEQKVIELTTCKSHLSSKTSDMQEEIESLTQELSTKDQTLTNLRATVQQQIEVIEQYKSQIKQAREKAQSLADEKIAENNDKLQEKILQIQTLELQIDKLTEDSQSFKGEANTFKKERESYQCQIQTKDEELLKTKEVLARVNEDLAQKVQQAQDAQQSQLQASIKEKLIQDLQSRLDSQQKHVQTLESEVKQIAESSQSEILKLNQRNHQQSVDSQKYIEDQSTSHSALIEEKDRKLKDLEQQIEAKVEEITSQKQELAESLLRQEQQAAEISEMMLQSEATLEEAHQVSTCLSEKEEACKHLSSQMELQATSLQSEIAQSQRKCDQLSKELEHEKKQNITLVNENLESLQQMAKVLEQKAKVEERVKGLEEKVKEAQKECQKYQTEVQERDDMISGLNGEIQEGQLLIKEAQDAGTALEKVQEKQIEGKETEIKGLKEKIESISEELKNLEQENSQIIKNRLKENDELIIKISELQKTIDHQKSTIESLNSKVLSQQDQMTSLKSEHEQSSKVFQDHIESLKQEMNNEKQQMIDEQATMQKQHEASIQSLQEESNKAHQEKILKIEAENKSKLDAVNKNQSQNQETFLGELSKMQEHTQKITNKALVFESSIDLIRDCCYKKIKIVQHQEGADQREITGILAEIQSLDEEIEKLNVNQDSESQQKHPGTEINLVVSQIVFEISKFYESKLTELRQKEKSRHELIQKDLKLLGEKYEKSKSDLQKSQAELNQCHVHTKDKLQSQQALLDKTTKEFQEQVSDLKSQIQTLKKQLKSSESVVAKDKVKISKLETKIKELNEQISKLTEEMNGYKAYLPEAEGLLQEVNKRHQSTQKELEIAQSHISNLKQECEVQAKEAEAKIESLGKDIQREKKKYLDLQEKMQKNIDTQEAKFEQVQEQVNILANSSKAAKQQKDQLWAQNQEQLEQMKGYQQNDLKMKKQVEKLMEDNSQYRQTIEQREFEMREVVKTLKDFSNDKKRVERDNERLKADIELLSGAQNQSYKVQLLMKIKDDNNALKEENMELKERVHEQDERLLKYVEKEQLDDELDQQKSQDLKQLKKQFNVLLSHLGSLQRFCRVAGNNKISIMQILPDQSYLHPESLQSVLELLTKVNDEDSQERVFSADNVKRGNRLLQNYQSSSKIPHLQQIPDANVTVTNHSSLAIKLPGEQERLKAQNYFIPEPEVDHTIAFIPPEIVNNQQRFQSRQQNMDRQNHHTKSTDQAGFDCDNYQFEIYNQPQRHTEERARHKNQRFGTLDGVVVERFDDNSQQYLENPRVVDPKSYGSLIEQTQSNEFSNIQSGIAQGNMTNRVTNVLPNSIEKQQQQSSPIVLNSYSSIYRNRDQSRNSKNSRGSNKDSMNRGKLSEDIVSAERYKEKGRIGTIPTSTRSFGRPNGSITSMNAPAIINQKNANAMPPQPTSMLSHRGSNLGRVSSLNSSKSGQASSNQINKHRQFKQNQMKQKNLQTARGASYSNSNNDTSRSLNTSVGQARSQINHQ